jgi:hypothetical protein
MLGKARSWSGCSTLAGVERGERFLILDLLFYFRLNGYQFNVDGGAGGVDVSAPLGWSRARLPRRYAVLEVVPDARQDALHEGHVSVEPLTCANLGTVEPRCVFQLRGT